MKSNLTYRITGVTLALVFALFNIGLPIVVASCPMMKYQNSRACIMCDDGPASGVTLTRAIDKSCCVTVFASDRNKTEFLQVSKQVLESAQQIVAVVSNVIPATLISNFHSGFSSHASPPIVLDIPILVSSLLI